MTRHNKVTPRTTRKLLAVKNLDAHVLKRWTFLKSEIVTMTKMSRSLKILKLSLKNSTQRAHGLNLNAGKGIKTESYRINSSPIQRIPNAKGRR